MRPALRATLLAVVVLAAPMTGVISVAGAAQDAGNSSGPSERWAKTVGGGDDDKLATGVQTDDGYLVVGWSNSSTEDETHDGYVAMLDRTGEPKWEQTYGGDGTDQIHDVETVEDGFLLVGTTTAQTGDQWNGWLVKINPNGEKQWEQTYSRRGDGSLRSITQSGDKLYVGGWQEDGGSAAAWAMELQPDGERVWSRTYDTVRSGTDEYVNSIFVDGGQLLMTGSILGGSDPSDAWVLKVGGDGDVKWDETYGGGKYDRVHDAVAASDGGYVIAGRTASDGNGEQDGWLFKIGSDGEKQWDRTYGTERRDNFFGIHDDADGGYVLSGVKHVLGPQGADGWVVKTDANGQQQWEQTYGENYWDKFWPVIEGHDGGYLAIGDSTSYGDDRQGWVVRVGGPAVAAIQDTDQNESGTTVRLDGSPVRAVTLSDANVSGYVSVAEQTNLSALSPPGEPLYGVEMNGSESVADAAATVEFTVETASVTEDVSDLRVAQRTSDGWNLLETTVVSEGNGTAVLSAETDGAATLVVTSVPAPTASIQSDEVVSVGESVELSAATSAGENAALDEYEWVVNGETMTGETATASFDEPGEYEVELTVTDEDGLRDTETVTLVVNDQPEASADAPDSMAVGKAGSFSADVSDEVGDATVTWQFPSGEVTGETVEHSFGSPGTKTVTLVVEDEYGATVTKEFEVEVQSQDEDATSSQPENNDSGIPGFGIGVALVALLATALLARRS